VEPPSAAFIVQLFLVPGLIVAIIVCVWLAFHWLAHLGNDPQAYVRTLRRDNEGRWQAALNLANDLRGPGGGALKSDEGLARELGRILTDESASARLLEAILDSDDRTSTVHIRKLLDGRVAIRQVQGGQLVVMSLGRTVKRHQLSD
jgi:hypothetical protein